MFAAWLNDHVLPPRSRTPHSFELIDLIFQRPMALCICELNHPYVLALRCTLLPMAFHQKHELTIRGIRTLCSPKLLSGLAEMQPCGNNGHVQETLRKTQTRPDSINTW